MRLAESGLLRRWLLSISPPLRSGRRRLLAGASALRDLLWRHAELLAVWNFARSARTAGPQMASDGMVREPITSRSFDDVKLILIRSKSRTPTMRSVSPTLSRTTCARCYMLIRSRLPSAVSAIAQPRCTVCHALVRSEQCAGVVAQASPPQRVSRFVPVPPQVKQRQHQPPSERPA